MDNYKNSHSRPEKTGTPEPPPKYSGQDSAKFCRRPSLITLCQERNISPFFASQLHVLKEYASIRIIIDDSGSMQTQERDHLGRAASGTRWHELQSSLHSMFDIACAAASTRSTDTHGDGIAGSSGSTDGASIDVYLLNGHTDGRGKYFPSVRSWAELQQHLRGLPVTGSTPTLACMQDLMLPSTMGPLGELPVLTVLFTDGEPDSGITQFGGFLRHVQTQYRNHFMTISLCTGDDYVVRQYNALDRDIRGLDVMDDYRSEKQEITTIQGRKFPFSPSDYLVKLLLGPRIELWDHLDERKLTRAQRKMFDDYNVAVFGGEVHKSSCAVM